MRPPSLAIPLSVARGMIGARQRALNFADAPMPGEFTLLFEMVLGLQKTKIAGLLVSSGLADALGKDSRAPLDLSSELGLDPGVTARVVDAAVALRLMKYDKAGRVRLTKLGRPLRRDHPTSIASVASFFANADTAAAHAHLDAQLRGGAEPSGYQRAFGKSMWEYFGDHPDVGTTFADAMRQLTAFDLVGILAAYPWPQEGVICDVAGGVGNLVGAILLHRPKARGILLDSPAAIEQADGFLRERGLADRIERRPGDLFGELNARADVYTLKSILHDWNDDACRDILKRVRATMPSGSKVVTIDLHHESGRQRQTTTPILDMLMLVCCEGGRERSPRDVHALMRDAGLTPGRVYHAGLTMLVEGIAP